MLCFDCRVFIYLSIKPNRMNFGGMIGYYRVKGHGQGHEKVKIFFLP